MTETFFVTGSTGCIGSWVVRTLLRTNQNVVALNFGDSLKRLELILQEEEINRINFISADISDLDQIKKQLEPYSISKIIHLAALQIPFCRANPSLGAKVNVVGTVNIFEVAKTLNIQRVVYASSAGVYGSKEQYSDEILQHTAPLLPTTLYGVYKMANEWTGKVYFSENGITSIGLRPHVVYGPGRDQGMTSTPTTAMLAAVKDIPFRISFSGKYNFQHAEDVARCFVKASQAEFQGADTFNIGGPAYSTQEIVETINQIIPASEGKITFIEKELPFVGAYDNSELIKRIGSIPFKSLYEGVNDTISIFQAAIDSGKFSQEFVDRLIKA